MMIVPLPADKHESLGACEPVRLEGTFRDEEEEEDGPGGTEGADDEEFVFPGGEGAVDLYKGK